MATYLWILLFLLSNQKVESDDVDLKPPKTADKFKVYFLEANSTYNFKPSKRGYFEKYLNTYCYSGKPKTLGRLLETVELQLEIENDDYTQYEGTTPQEVEEHYNDHRSLFSFNLFSQNRRSRLSLSPFLQQCIGIETVQSYSVHLLQDKMDYWRGIMLLSGITIFLFAGHLSANQIFFYITGIAFGICSSFLLLIWICGKLMPRRTMMYGVLIGGWTVGFYVIRMLWDNLQIIMMTYRNYVCWYIIITGLISFFLCYFWGPPKNQRSKNIIKWLLQLMSLVLIYFSSNFKEAIVAVIFMTITLYYFPRVLKRLMSFRGNKTRKTVNSFIDQRSGGMPKDLRDECKEWRINSPQHKEEKIKPKSRPSINSSRSISNSRTSLHLNEKSNFDPTNCNAEENQSESDVSFSENNLSRQKLYPLPDGSFILSDKRPIIITPRHTTPIYYRSTPVVSGDENGNDDPGDITPKLHHVPLAAHTRRLTAAASTSDLFVKSRRSIPSPSQFQRSSSVHRVQSRSSRMLATAKKVQIKIQKPESDESEEE